MENQVPNLVWFLEVAPLESTYGIVAGDWERHHQVSLQQLLGLIITSVVALLLEGWMRLLMPDFSLQTSPTESKLPFTSTLPL